MHYIIFNCLDLLLCCVTFRYDSNSGGEREIQRTMLELLNQLDGFDSRGDVKVRLISKSKVNQLLVSCKYLMEFAILLIFQCVIMPLTNISVFSANQHKSE